MGNNLDDRSNAVKVNFRRPIDANKRNYRDGSQMHYLINAKLIFIEK